MSDNEEYQASLDDLLIQREQEAQEAQEDLRKLTTIPKRLVHCLRWWFDSLYDEEQLPIQVVQARSDLEKAQDSIHYAQRVIKSCTEGRISHKEAVLFLQNDSLKSRFMYREKGYSQQNAIENAHRDFEQRLQRQSSAIHYSTIRFLSL